MPPYLAFLQALPGNAARLAVAVQVLQGTRDAFGHIEVPQVRDYLDEGLRLSREAVAAGRERVDLPPALLDSFADVDDAATDFGTSQLLSAVLACADAPDGLTAEVTHGVLDFCYEAILIKELPDPTPELERRNVACVGALRMQQEAVIHSLWITR
jgi:hypothetical protein